MKAKRTHIVVGLLLLTPLGFCAKFYTGPGASWVNNSLAGMLYVIFWCLVVFLFLPGARPVTIAVSVLAATCGLEFLQLWHPPFLEHLRSYFIGRTILGQQFAWTDFPYYIVGAVLGYVWMIMTFRTKEAHVKLH